MDLACVCVCVCVCFVSKKVMPKLYTSYNGRLDRQEGELEQAKQAQHKIKIQVHFLYPHNLTI